ncbi:asparagine synthase (glutamine-hydrolyzing) [Sorangium sp. So ce321]|uniref:asparagine synthase (glutamine-hydrolyzing) n=1 Tax=Sorangium sp. So ce321 TaxID=3133300 RepID=UPI003F625002
MCGIAAVISAHKRDHTDLLLHMLRKIEHRGDVGHFGEIKAFPTGAMGTNRLAIVDRDNARQPISSTNGRYWVVFNGEIYNHAALREELRQLGCRFATECDTEVIVQGYQRWGPEVVRRLDGSFAFVIFDAESKSSFAARDPMGIKPLYWAVGGSSLATGSGNDALLFASEQKCLAPHAQEVCTLAPGHYLEDGRSHRYFDIEERSPEREEPVARCRRLLGEAVRKRVDTDLPVAVMFSGGIDSTTVLYLARKFHPNVTAFTLGFPGATDLEVATRFCREFDIPQIICPLREDETIALLPRVAQGAEFFEGIDAMDACLAYFGYQQAHEHGFKVALCGEGADEVLMGYDLFLEQADPDALMRYRVSNLHRTDVQRVDRAAMLNRVEARVPFLDIEFLRFCYHLPASMKLRDGTSKWVLREAFRGELPDYILRRPKVRMPDGTGLHRLLYDHAGQQTAQVDPSLEVRLGIENRQQAYFLQLYLAAGLPVPKERFRRPGLDYNTDGYFRFVTPPPRQI